MSTKYTCNGRISLGAFYGSKLCGKTAKFVRDGRHYCGTHDPVTIAVKNAAKTAKWKAEWEAKDAARDAAKAKQSEIERRADCYPELLEALQDALKTANFEGHPYRGWHSKANVVIAKALGEQA